MFYQANHVLVYIAVFFVKKIIRQKTSVIFSPYLPVSIILLDHLVNLPKSHSLIFCFLVNFVPFKIYIMALFGHYISDFLVLDEFIKSEIASHVFLPRCSPSCGNSSSLWEPCIPFSHTHVRLGLNFRFLEFFQN